MLLVCSPLGESGLRAAAKASLSRFEKRVKTLIPPLN